MLVAAGLSGSGATAAPTASAESYDPTAETWSSAGSLTTARYDATTTLLPNGQVLVAGGLTGATAPFGATNTAELYNPSSNTWSAAAAMTTARFGASATLLSNGSVLVAGGDTGNSTTATATNTAELYNPSTNSWSAAGSLTTRAGLRQLDGAVQRELPRRRRRGRCGEHDRHGGAVQPVDEQLDLGRLARHGTP